MKTPLYTKYETYTEDAARINSAFLLLVQKFIDENYKNYSMIEFQSILYDAVESACLHKRVSKSLADRKKDMSNKTYSGLIKELPINGIFVYGANTEGRHGAGAAKTAKEKFGAVHGKVGLEGQSYGIITKDLQSRSQPSISKWAIMEQIDMLYQVARNLPSSDFYVAYSGTGVNLNHYSPLEMAQMFKTNDIPINIVFEEKFYKLVMYAN